MKLNRLILAAFAAVAVFACNKPEPEPEPKDTTPAELKSFALLKADNADILTEDVTVETIAPTMVVRIPGGGAGKTLVAAVTAGENDVIKANGKEAVDGKITFDASAPVDIIVTNTKSELTATYEVKVGKILATVASFVGSYTEPDAVMGSDCRIAINPKDNSPYILYTRKKTVDGTAEKNNRLSVIRWDGTAFAAVGSLGFTDVDRQAIMCDLSFCGETPYVLSYGETAASIAGVRKFTGTEWEPVGEKGFSEKVNTTYGKPQLVFVGNNPSFVTTGNPAKTEPGYRNAVRYNFDGTSWNYTAQIPGIPLYGAKGGNDGIFYSAVPAVNSKGEIYYVMSCNLYGYYLYTLNGSSWEKVIDNFLPTGEEYGIPTNLDLKFGPNDNLYLLAASSKAAQEQVYRFNATSKTFEPYGNMLQLTAGSNGSVAESMLFDVNPQSGEIIGIMIKEKKPSLAVIDENRQWTEFKDFANTDTAGGDTALAMGADGVAYYAFIAKSESGTTSVELYKIGLEEDILPE